MNFPTCSHAPGTILHPLLWANPFGLWEVLLGHSLHQDLENGGHTLIINIKFIIFLNNLGTSWGLFRRLLGISQESWWSPRLYLVWNPEATSSSADGIQNPTGWKGPGGWSLCLQGMQHANHSCQRSGPALPVPQVSLTSGEICSISSAKLHLALCANP